ncbi:MAG: protein-glutamate O-methyltransferase family protein [Candidatus Omnitrophica bacterium]|nr:protein-glutamate O-methyltransferase family protein [Candidatus Omnitrophota bacterium]
MTKFNKDFNLKIFLIIAVNGLFLFNSVISAASLRVPQQLDEEEGIERHLHAQRVMLSLGMGADPIFRDIETLMAVATDSQISMGEVWNQEAEDRVLLALYISIGCLPISPEARERVLDAVKSGVEKRVMAKKDMIDSLIVSRALAVTYSILTDIYRDALNDRSIIGEEEYQQIKEVNSYLDPFYPIKREVNEQAIEGLDVSINGLFGFQGSAEERLHKAIEVSALGNRIATINRGLSAGAQSSPIHLVDHRDNIIGKLNDSTTKKIAICIDNAEEIFSDFILIHSLLSAGKQVVIYARNEPYGVKDVLVAEVPGLIEMYDGKFQRLFSSGEYKSLRTYLSSNRLMIATDRFTTSGLGFSSIEGLMFAKELKEQGFQIVILKGGAWVQQFMDGRRVSWAEKVKNPWPIDVVSLHVVKHPKLIFDTPYPPDMSQCNVVMRFVPASSIEAFHVLMKLRERQYLEMSLELQ